MERLPNIEDYKKTIQDLKLDEGATSDRITKVVKLNYSDPAASALLLAPYLTPSREGSDRCQNQ